MNKIQKQDIKDFVASFPLKDELKDATFLVTGATGLIGSSFIKCLLSLEKDIKIIAPVRNKSKAEKLFEDYVSKICILECNIMSFDYASLGRIDYIIHCAAPTSSKYFVNYPVETFNEIYESTSVLLEYAKKHPVKSFVYLSSLEVYGSIYDDTESVTEDKQGELDILSVRSSYPMAKRATETLCSLYYSEYNVPVKIARLTQTTGAGVSKDDNRIIAQFARLLVEGKDIILFTSGESARPYLYLTDAISGILYILLKGKAGEAYNVANEETYISAKNMACYLVDNFNSDINVQVELKGNMGYAPETKLRLSSQKLRDLGWKPKYGLNMIFERLIDYLKSS